MDFVPRYFPGKIGLLGKIETPRFALPGKRITINLSRFGQDNQNGIIQTARLVENRVQVDVVCDDRVKLTVWLDDC